MKNITHLLLILVVLFVLGYAVLQKGGNERLQTQDLSAVIELCGPQRPSGVSIETGNLAISAELACTEDEQNQGLSGRERLALGTGMLFPFAEDNSHAMWMKDMRFALDMVWIAADGTIVHIEEGVSPESFPATFSSPSPARFVLEINSGVISSTSVTVGEKVAILPR